MSNSPLSSENASSIVARAKGIIISPKDEWPKIATEPSSVSDVFIRYVLPLAAIGPLAAFIGGQVFGFNTMLISYRPSLMSGVTTLITSYVLSLVGLFVVAFIANFLAPKFDGKDDFTRAFKLCAYAFTAAWVIAIVQIVPALGILAILGLYSLYLFYLGVTPMVGVPADKAAAYTAITVICAIVVNIIVGVIAASITGAFIGASAYPTARDEVSVSIPGMAK